MKLEARVSGVPYIDQYLGVWSMYPPALQSFRSLAEQVNVNVHMSNEPQAIVAVRGSDIGSVTNRDGIAVIELHGTLLKHSSSFSANTSTVDARRLVRAAKNDSEVAGVLFHIDSPGGTVAGTDDLAADIRSLQSVKPTMAYIEDLGASAAYWLAAQTGTVYSNASAVVGSIGVLTVVYDLSRKAEAENITVHLIKAGEMKGAGVPGTQITDEQLAEWQKLIDAFYGDFITAVTDGRKLPRARVQGLADGRVHTGTVAAELGLTDGVRSLDEAVSELTALTQRGSSKRGMKMSDDHTEDVAAKAATPAELKSALPNADPGFLFAQIERGATVADAREAYADAREAKIAEQEAAIEEAQKAAVKASPVQKAQSQQPLTDNAVDESTFESIVSEYRETKGLSRRDAMLAVAKSHPELHQDFLNRCPPGRTQSSELR